MWYESHNERPNDVSNYIVHRTTFYNVQNSYRTQTVQDSKLINVKPFKRENYSATRLMYKTINEKQIRYTTPNDNHYTNE